MGASTLTNIGLTAMAAQFAGLQTTGHNIANASVKGYSRQEVSLSTKPAQWSNGAYYGRGVDISSVTRSHDEYLTREASNTQSLASMDAVQLKQMQSLQNLFMPGDRGLGTVTSSIFDAMGDLASNPSDLSARQVVLSRADNIAVRFSDASAMITTLQTGVTSDLKSAVDTINSLAQNIAHANSQIAATRGSSEPPNDLLDQRDQLIAKLAEQISISRVDNSDGSTSIFVAGGQSLVMGIDTNKMVAGQDQEDSTRTGIYMTQGTSLRPITDSSLAGGEVAGLLKFQNKDLVDGRNLIGRLALTVGSALNAQQSRGITMEAPIGTKSGPPFFTLGAPQSLPNANNAKSALGQPIGSVSMTISDYTAVMPSDYALRQDAAAPGGLELTRLSDGKVTQIANGDTVDGITFDVQNLQAGDRFLLQPVGRAASGMVSILSDPRAVAAASQLTATMDSANTGTASVARLTVTASPIPQPTYATEIAFTDDLGNYTWTLKDPSGASMGGGTGTWVAGQPIPTPPQDFNGFTLELNGVPKNGDKVLVSPISSTSVGTNNGNALAMAALREAQIMGSNTYNEGWTDAMSQVGVRVQTLQSASSLSTAVAQTAEQQRSSASGVNMDEEAARLLQYQQSYQAAAKVLSVATTIFDTLLQATGR
jgi:flagellar hook-associated protein 1 FlgK